MGWHGLFDYPRYVWHVEQTMGHGAIVPSDMPNLRGLLASALTDRMSKLGLQVLTVLLSLLLIFFTAAKWRSKSSPDSLDLIFSLCVVTTVVVSYHAFAYDLCLLLVPIVLVLGYLRRQRTTPSLTRIALLLPVALLFVGPLQMLLWLRYGQLCILTILLGAWAWGISRAISEDSEQRQIPVPADY